MHSTTPTLTYIATVQNQNGTERRVAISLPLHRLHRRLSALRGATTARARAAADHDAGRRWSKKLIRSTLGKDREQTARLLNQIGYEAALRRIDSGGV